MISVIIPTYNDEGFVKSTIAFLKEHAYTRLVKEIIVVDGGSTDGTLREAREAGAIILRSIRKGRSVLMNLGADCASGEILYFVSPGCLPPQNYSNEIVRRHQNKSYIGTFTGSYSASGWMMKGISWLTSVTKRYARLESQSLFVDRNLFMKAGKFREDLPMLEDHDLINRLRKYSRFDIIRDTASGSVRRFNDHSVLRTELCYFIAYWLYDIGCSVDKIARFYHFILGSSPVDTAETQAELSASFN